MTMWDMLADEFSGTFAIPVTVLAMRLAGTALLCGLIGLEREIKKDSAGLRTNIMIGLASATFALITIALVRSDLSTDAAIRADPLRLVEAVTAGVAFLAAGIIIFARGEVRGLTTGATMWLSASIGLATGLGFWIIAVMAAVAGVIVLTVLRRLEVYFGMKDGGGKD